MAMSGMGDFMAKKTPKGKLGKVAKKAPLPEPYLTDPASELRRLVREHTNLIRSATRVDSMASDRKSRVTGETIPCKMPADAQVEFHALAEATKLRASRLERQMKRELTKLPIWKHFLSRVFGLASGGPIAAYLAASIDIHKATKPSNLIRYCGYAVIGGHLERPSRGEKLHYNAEMRMRLHQWADVLWKATDRAEAASPYALVMRNSWRADQTSPLLDAKANTWTASDKAHKGGKAIIMSKAKRKGITRMLEDMYIVWRAIEGLPAWPTYYEQQMKAAHGGVVLKDLAPVVRTVEQATDIVFGTHKVN